MKKTILWIRTVSTSKVIMLSLKLSFILCLKALRKNLFSYIEFDHVNVMLVNEMVSPMWWNPALSSRYIT